ncbi:MAG: CBS domain-containing protein [Candidatus Omnitrophica bacterium]|nr:CBS domain-containing protein [Candidatus Omnitrophota bacterium]
MAKVKEIIAGRKCFAVDSKASVKKISKILTERKLTSLPVVDSRGKLVGVVSEKDIIKNFNSNKFLKMTAKDIMTKNVTCVKESDALEKVAKIFSDKSLRKLPVIKRGKLIGCITRDDVISSFMKYY